MYNALIRLILKYKLKLHIYAIDLESKRSNFGSNSKSDENDLDFEESHGIMMEDVLPRTKLIKLPPIQDETNNININSNTFQWPKCVKFAAMSLVLLFAPYQLPRINYAVLTLSPPQGIRQYRSPGR